MAAEPFPEPDQRPPTAPAPEPLTLANTAPGLIKSLQRLMDEYGPAGVASTLDQLVAGHSAETMPIIDGVLHEWAPTWQAGALWDVERLHSARDYRSDRDGNGWAVCAECRQVWPCATSRAIRKAQTDG